jgi:hypothetical protein
MLSENTVTDTEVAILIHAQCAQVGGKNILEHEYSAGLSPGLLLQVADKLSIVSEYINYLSVEIIQIKSHNGVNKKGADYRHQRHNEQYHNEYQLHVQASKHGFGTFSLVLCIFLNDLFHKEIP